jgi:hypothetical protein
VVIVTICRNGLSIRADTVCVDTAIGIKLQLLEVVFLPVFMMLGTMAVARLKRAHWK